MRNPAIIDTMNKRCYDILPKKKINVAISKIIESFYLYHLPIDPEIESIWYYIGNNYIVVNGGGTPPYPVVVPGVSHILIKNTSMIDKIYLPTNPPLPFNKILEMKSIEKTGLEIVVTEPGITSYIPINPVVVNNKTYYLALYYESLNFPTSTIDYRYIITTINQYTGSLETKVYSIKVDTEIQSPNSVGIAPPPIVIPFENKYVTIIEALAGNTNIYIPAKPVLVTMNIDFDTKTLSSPKAYYVGFLIGVDKEKKKIYTTVDGKQLYSYIVKSDGTLVPDKAYTLVPHIDSNIITFSGISHYNGVSSTINLLYTVSNPSEPFNVDAVVSNNRIDIYYILKKLNNNYNMFANLLPLGENTMYGTVFRGTPEAVPEIIQGIMSNNTICGMKTTLPQQFYYTPMLYLLYSNDELIGIGNLFIDVSPVEPIRSCCDIYYDGKKAYECSCLEVDPDYAYIELVGDGVPPIYEYSSVSLSPSSFKEITETPSSIGNRVYPFKEITKSPSSIGNRVYTLKEIIELPISIGNRVYIFKEITERVDVNRVC